MKTPEQVDKARRRLRERIRTPGLNSEQKALIVGMLNAIILVAEGQDGETMERMLSDEPIAAGKDPKPALDRLDQITKPKEVK